MFFQGEEMMETERTMYSHAAQIMRARGMKEEDLQTEGMTLLYSIMSQKARIVWMISDEALGQLDRAEIGRYTERIRHLFAERPCTSTELLTVFFTGNVGTARSIGEGTNYWIADEKEKKVIVEEGQPEEFLGLHGVLTTFCRIKNGVSSESAGRMNDDAEPVHIKLTKTAGARQTPYRGFPLFTILLLVANVFIYSLMITLDVDCWEGGMNWNLMIGNHQYYRLITSMFLHADIGHLVGNMFCLALYGWRLEKIIGHVRFILCYFVTGLFAGLVSALIHLFDGDIVISIGASGAIFGIAGALIVMLVADPDNRKSGNILNAIACYMIPFYALRQEGGLRTLLRTTAIVILIENIIYAADGSSGVDNYAHMGGLLSGLVFALVLCISWYRQDNRRVNA